MATAIDTLKIYERLRKANLGDDAAKEIAEVIKEASDSSSVIKTEIKEELSKELSTKSDLLLVETRLSGEIKRLDDKIDNGLKNIRLEMKLYFLLLSFLIILTNPRALDLISKLLGIVK